MFKVWNNWLTFLHILDHTSSQAPSIFYSAFVGVLSIIWFDNVGVMKVSIWSYSQITLFRDKGILSSYWAVLLCINLVLAWYWPLAVDTEAISTTTHLPILAPEMTMPWRNEHHRFLARENKLSHNFAGEIAISGQTLCSTGDTHVRDTLHSREVYWVVVVVVVVVVVSAFTYLQNNLTIYVHRPYRNQGSYIIGR